MALARSRDTRPEVLLRSLVAAAGVRFRKINDDLPGSPDMANRSRRWAIFMHGCFWHGHARCGKAAPTKRNQAFWREKLVRNKRRDRRVVRALRRLGFDVLVVWECALKPKRRTESAERIRTWLAERSAR